MASFGMACAFSRSSSIRFDHASHQIISHRRFRYGASDKIRGKGFSKRCRKSAGDTKYALDRRGGPPYIEIDRAQSPRQEARGWRVLEGELLSVRPVFCPILFLTQKKRCWLLAALARHKTQEEELPLLCIGSGLRYWTVLIFRLPSQRAMGGRDDGRWTIREASVLSILRNAWFGGGGQLGLVKAGGGRHALARGEDRAIYLTSNCLTSIVRLIFFV
jgi:hypothetical protein